MSDEYECVMTCWTTSSYNKGCRLPPCTDAHRLAKQRSAAKLRAKPFDQIPHGTVNGYVNYWCRCPDCKVQGSTRNREYREKVKALKAQGD